MATSNKELATEIPNVIRVYKDGTVDRLLHSTYAPPSLQNPTDGGTTISSKDVTISANVSARLYHPNLTLQSTKLPILVYFHGGGFCLGSAFTKLEHDYLNTIVSHCNTLTVSVEYRLAPEHLLPAAYEDCWAALQWVASHSVTHQENLDPWLVEFGDFDRLYIGGDSAGGNIVHNVAVRAGKERLNGDVKILVGFLFFPYFWGSKIGLGVDDSVYYKLWKLSYPDASGGIDNPMINPLVDSGARRLLAELGCKKLLVVVAEKDGVRENGIKYYEGVKESRWNGEIELVDVEGEDHCFQAFDLNGEKAKWLFQRLASFIS